MSEIKDFDFSLFTDRQLQKLCRQVIQEVAQRREEARNLRQQSDILESDSPRYRNPDNPSETWSGRGRVPAWVERALMSGLGLDQMELADNRPAPRVKRRRTRRGA